MLRFRGVVFERNGPYATRIERSFDVPWTYAGVVEAFGHQLADAKDRQQGWSAARYRIGATRGNAGVEVVHAATLETDCGDVGELDRVCAWLDARGLAYIVYTTWSSGKAEKSPNDLPHIKGPFDCFRVVLPYDRDVSKDEHRAIVRGLYGHEVPHDPPHYAREAEGVYVQHRNGRSRAARPRGWDPVCERAAQLYYAPSEHSVLEVHSGRPVAVEDVLARPTTPKVTAQRQRPYQAPTPLAQGALGAVERALRAQGFHLGEAGYSGWRRSVCPSCQDSSPSLTVRANGDGVDIHCHAGCTRLDVLSALGLEGDQFATPSDLMVRLEEQFSRQAPADDAVTADEAGELLEADIDAALAAREPTVVEYPAGTGKSFRAARSMAKVARKGLRICYATQEHAVAHETRMKLPPDVRARSVHIHSPLIKVGDEPVCARAEELQERVFEYGVSLLGSVCPKCPKRANCAALEAAKERGAAVQDASVVFVSHAGIRQVFGVDSDGRVRGADTLLIVDEMPGTYERVEVAPDQLRALADGAVLVSAEATIARVVQELAKATLERREPGDVSWQLGGKVLGNALELAKQWGRLSLREGARPHPDEAKLLRAADALVRLVCFAAEGHTLLGAEDPVALGLAAMLPDACHQALVQRRGVLLSATPMLPALPGFQLRQQAVQDGSPVRRLMVLRGARGSKALTENYYDDTLGKRVRRDREPGEEPGVPWPWVDEALARALEEADRYGPKARVLFVTFKTVADLLREHPERLAGGRVEVAHYGALRGKNDWQEGAEREVKVVYCFGTPRFAIYPTLVQLGLTGEAADEAWVAYAAGELTQAEGRLRLPRRTTPCTVVVEGDVAPSTWHADNVDAVITAPAHYETATALLEGALLWYELAELAGQLEVSERSVRRWRQPGCPPPAEKHVELLRELAYPDVYEAMALFANMPTKRRKARLEEMSTAVLDDCD